MTGPPDPDRLTAIALDGMLKRVIAASVAKKVKQIQPRRNLLNVSRYRTVSPPTAPGTGAMKDQGAYFGP
ncbi:hypothetical protein GCM10009115_10230 [Sphingopyxis soli]|uniref:Uncharacterized protein n=1 Tax=Sphingopyxis soli TaxID=592051 RepID=A0ABP3XEZ3_9SPHN